MWMTFIIFKHKDHITPSFDFRNKQQQKTLNFPLKIKPTFLDVLVKRKDHRFYTSQYF